MAPENDLKATSKTNCSSLCSVVELVLSLAPYRPTCMEIPASVYPRWKRHNKAQVVCMFHEALKQENFGCQQ